MEIKSSAETVYTKKTVKITIVINGKKLTAHKWTENDCIYNIYENDYKFEPESQKIYDGLSEDEQDLVNEEIIEKY